MPYGRRRSSDRPRGSAAAAAAGISYEFLASTSSGANATTYTYTGVNFGVATADRLIVVTSIVGGASNLTVASATIGGVATTPVFNDSGRVQIIQAIVPTGTSGDIAITLSAGAGRHGIGVHAIKGYTSATHVDVDDDLTLAGQVTATAILTVPANGVAIAGGWTSATTTLSGWAGATSRFSGVMGAETQTQAGASHESAIELIDHNMAVTFNASGFMHCAAASWA